MIVLHLSVFGESFQLWGESSAESAGLVETGKAARGGPDHPFSAAPGELAGALRAMSIRPSRKRSRVVAWLPSTRNQPTASTPLLDKGHRKAGRVAVSPWWIEALPLAVAETRTFLRQAGRRRVLAPGVLAGPSLAFWLDVDRFALGMAARQAFLPGLVNRRGLEARWLPVYRGADSEAFQRLCDTMPASARCLSALDVESPGTPARTIIDWLVQSTVDDLVRKAAPTSRAEPRESVDEAWRDALTTADGRIVWPSEEGLDDFCSRMEEWRRPLLATAHAKFRLCFRLDDPETTKNDPTTTDHSDRWRMLCLIHPREDRSLLVPVADLWESDDRRAAILEGFGDVREYLLTALGHAAAICPLVASGLEARRPGETGMDTTEAHEFLTRHAPALETAGFGVLLPAWWSGRGPRRRLGVRAKAKSPAMQTGAGLSLRQVVDVDWELVLGDTEISLEEVHKLAKLKAPLVRIRGQWLELEPGQLEHAAALLRKQEEGRPVPLGDLLRAALGADSQIDDLPLMDVRADGWINELLGKLKEDQGWRSEPPPTHFRGTLRPYQTRGYSWLSFLRRWGLGGCLADDMGLGKTVQTLALVERERELGENRPVLLVCPTSVLNNWRREAERFTPALQTMLHHGVGRHRGEALLKGVAGRHVVITSYPLLHRDLKALRRVDWAGVILDEAQNIKNPETAQSKAARGLRGDYRIALTGTPVENHVGDLWAIMDFLNPGLLGGEAAFKKTFFQPIQLLRSPEAVEKLKRLTAPFILRRVKTDRSIISDLPEKMEMKTLCALTKEQASLYAAVVAETETALRESDGIQRRGIVLATLSKLKQVCNHPAQFLGDNSALEGRSGKLTRLQEMLEEILETRERALIFTQFAQMGSILKRQLERSFGRETLFLHGSVSKPRRDEMVERFQREGAGPPFFVLSLKAGGTGLNLTRASHVFHFDRWWNPAVENQATDRAYRIGQQKRVQVHKLICAGTLEERIDAMIEAKSSLAEQVVGSGEGWLTRLSNQELKQILQLGEDATLGAESDKSVENPS